MALPLCCLLITVHVHPVCVSDPGAAGRSIGAGVPQPGEPSEELINNLTDRNTFYLLQWGNRITTKALYRRKLIRANFTKIAWFSGIE